MVEIWQKGREKLDGVCKKKQNYYVAFEIYCKFAVNFEYIASYGRIRKEEYLSQPSDCQER